MDITKYIYDFLMEHNTFVVVPELGCFSIVNKPSEIRDGTILPPVKTVEFDSENTANDNVLTRFIAEKENTTMEQVTDEICRFYNYFFRSKLTKEKEVVFEKFGTFLLDEMGNMIFTPDTDFFTDNYGLDHAHIPGATTSQPQNDQPESDVAENSLFDTSDRKRFRENKERRRPATEKQERPSVKPKKPVKTTPYPKKRQEQMRSDGTSLWLLWVLLGAVGLAAAGYYFYPVIYQSFFSNNTTISTIVDADNEAKPLYSIETEEETPNSDVAQTLDDATEKKNALNPDQQQQTASVSSSDQDNSTTSSSEQTQEAVSSTPIAEPKKETVPSAPIAEPKKETVPSTPKTEPKKETVTQQQPQGSVGQGKYVLIIASLTTHADAEKFGKKLTAKGINYEIIDAGNQRFRISVAGFDDKAEAVRQANQMKSKPYCENVWVAKR